MPPTHGPQNLKYAYYCYKLSQFLQARADMFVPACLLDISHSRPELVAPWSWPSAYSEGHGKKKIKKGKIPPTTDGLAMLNYDSFSSIEPDELVIVCIFICQLRQ